MKPPTGQPADTAQSEKTVSHTGEKRERQK